MFLCRDRNILLFEGNSTYCTGFSGGYYFNRHGGGVCVVMTYFLDARLQISVDVGADQPGPRRSEVFYFTSLLPWFP